MSSLQKSDSVSVDTSRAAINSQVRRQQDILWSTLKSYRKLNELPDGYELTFPRTGKWLTQLEQFRSLCATHIPVFDIALIDQADFEDLRLVIRTSAAGKDYLQKSLRIAQLYKGRRIGLFRKSMRLAPRLLTSPFRVLPDFIIIGAARCGTTSLYSWLATHPNILQAMRKELYFFDRTYHRGLVWYRTFFPTARQMRASSKRERARCFTGEATPDYLFHPHAPKRMSKALPQAKLIVVLRNPVQRAYSNYNLHLRRGIETLSFEEAIECEEQRLQGEFEKMLEDPHYYSYNRQNFSYLSRGIYVDQLRRWLQFYPAEQILVLNSADLNRDLASCNTRLMEFLGLPEWQPPARKIIHSVPNAEMNDETREYLTDYFKPHNQRLYEFLGRDFGW